MATWHLSFPDGEGNCTCCPCHAQFGDEIDVVISGVGLCNCYDIGSNEYQASSFTGVNGSFVAVWQGPTNPRFWQVTVGTITVQQYVQDATCGTPIGSPVTKDLVLGLECNSNKFTVDISINPEGPIFSGHLVELDTSPANEIQCFTLTSPMGGGFITLSLPT